MSLKGDEGGNNLVKVVVLVDGPFRGDGLRAESLLREKNWRQERCNDGDDIDWSDSTD